MKHAKTVVAVCVVLAAALTFAYSQAGKPKTYEDCVLKHIKNAENNQASSAIIAACRKKFPGEPNPFDQFDNDPPTTR
jgi:hypothetical protein